jgi:methyl-accepting chemotaxis protein
MSSAVEQVAQSAVGLQESVEASTASIHEMGSNIRRVAESSDEVQQVAQETAAATTEMDCAIQEVGGHVRGASDLTRRVSESANQGSEAVNATINDIAIIRDQTLKAKRALEGLAVRVNEIGQIATVIGGISDETNLLSLNAAIIAAQAGEHGKAFAVVADQVKTLSRRTNTSAKQIEEMIRTVQGESTNAVEAMGAGIRSVEEGVKRSRVAGEALEVIRTSASDANGQVSEISRASEEQARNSKHVASAAARVSENVEQISRAMGEQSTASEALLRSANTYLDMCRQMAQAMEEQRETGRYITANSQSVTEMIGSIQSKTALHAEASRQVDERFETLLQLAHKTTAGMPAVAQVISELCEQVKTTHAEVQSGEHSADA